MAAEKKFAIVGLGVVNGRGLAQSSRTLQAEAARRAIADAGLRKSDIDGAINAQGVGGSMPGAGGWVDGFSRVLGLPAKFYWSMARGGSGSLIGLVAAMQALEAGIANYVVIACGDAAWSGAHGKLAANPTGRGRAGRGNYVLGNEMLGFSGAATAGGLHAFFATRHMYEYGTTSEHFGAVAVSCRQWACLNPEAQMHGRPITIDDHQNSPLIVEPYHLLDCCLDSDAGVAVVITRAERAKELKKPPVFVMGLGFGDHARKLWWDKSNYTQLDVAPAKEAAFRQAGITLEDIDVAELYDCFTAEVLFQLEDYGWCKKGQGGPFVADGATAPGGKIPVNTGGGLLSGFYLFDYTGLAEAVRQLRGDAGARQVKDAEIALVTGHGGEMLVPGMCSTHGCAILGR
ncbi:MAG TPA: thiolase family protein [Beijerinckiaceae bacterium]|nr:thiolase family protein [Beijerinckiaceae bacterium]